MANIWINHGFPDRIQAMARRWIACILVLILSCSGAQVKKGPDAKELYDEASKELEGRKLFWLIPVKDYQAAIESFQKVIDRYPYSQWAVLAELKIADATFLKGDYLEAVNLYKEFQKRHPTNENIPYVIFQMGLSYLNYQDDLSIFGGIPHDKDLIAVENAIVEFVYVTDYYPTSPYAEKAGEKAVICKNIVAKHELYVGDFYFSRNKYQSAIPRYRRIVEEFPGSLVFERALYDLGLCYVNINESSNAREILTRLIESFPQGAYTSEARRILASISSQADKDL